jgi:UDP-glucose 4-epimerase
MHALITGGAGFVGSHLAERLLELGHHVSVLDDLSSGSTHNVEHLRKAAGFRLVQGSVTDRGLLEGLVHAADSIYHLAAPVGVQLVSSDPLKVIDTNVHGTAVVLQLAAGGGKRVLLASTSEVYGRRERMPFREDDDLIIGPPDNGRWSYACSKLLDEFLGLACWKQQRVPVVIARLFNVVGPRQTARYGMVVPRLTEQALSGATMTVFGDGTQRRCFTHIRDAVRGLIALAEHPDAAGQVYNVGSTNEMAIGDLARRIKAISGSRSKIEFIPYDQIPDRDGQDLPRRVPDLTKIHRLTGYVPACDIDTILRDTLAHCTAQRATAAHRAASAVSA